MANQVRIDITSVFDPSGLDQSAQRFRQFTQEIQSGQEQLARYAITRQRSIRTGEGGDQAERAYSEQLKRQADDAAKLVGMYDKLKERRADLQKQLDALKTSGQADPKRQFAIEAELADIDQPDIPKLGRRATRLALDAEIQVDRYERQRQKEQERSRREQERAEEERKNKEEESKETRARVAATIGGAVLLQSLRGMPLSEQTGALRYRIGAPGTYGGVESNLWGRMTFESPIDKLGREISDVGRAMSYSRLETLKAADAYSSVAGRLGKQLIPEVEQLSRAARFLRMDFGEAGQFFGHLRRLTPEDDPKALNRIIGVVTNAVQSAGPRGDEMRDAIKYLASRAAQGSPEGLTGQSLEIQVAMLRTLNDIAKERQLPGFQGQAGAEAIAGMSQFGFNSNDMTDVIRYRLVTGTADQLEGDPWTVLGKGGLEMERLRRGDFRNEEMVDRVFNAWQYAQTRSPTPEGQAKFMQRAIGVPLSMDQIIKLQETLMSGKGREALKETLLKMGDEKFEGPDKAQRGTGYMEDQEAIRKVTDALEQLGEAATYARNKLYMVGVPGFGGSFGDFMGLGMQTLGYGLGGYGLFRGVRGLSSMGGKGNILRRTISGGINLGRRAWNFGRGARTATQTANVVNQASRWQRARQLIGREFNVTRAAWTARGARAAEAVKSVRWPQWLSIGRGAATAAKVQRATQTASTASRAARLASMGRWGLQRAPIVGTAVDIGMTGYALHQRYKLARERAAADKSKLATQRMEQKVFPGQQRKMLDQLAGYDSPELIHEARGLYFQKLQEERRVTVPHKGWWDRLKLWGKDVTGTDTYTERTTPGAAKEWAEREMERRHGAKIKDRESLDLSDMLRSSRLDLSNVGTGATRSFFRWIHIKLDVNVTGKQDIGKAIADKAGEILEQRLPDDIYEPIYSGNSRNGRLA